MHAKYLAPTNLKRQLYDKASFSLLLIFLDTRMAAMTADQRKAAIEAAQRSQSSKRYQAGIVPDRSLIDQL